MVTLPVWSFNSFWNMNVSDEQNEDFEQLSDDDQDENVIRSNQEIQNFLAHLENHGSLPTNWTGQSCPKPQDESTVQGVLFNLQILSVISFMRIFDPRGRPQSRPK